MFNDEPLKKIDELIDQAHIITKKFEFRQQNAIYIPVEQAEELHTEWTFVTNGDKKVMAPF